MALLAVADIGGTNCRVASFVATTSPTSAQTFGRARTVPTKDIANAQALWQLLRGICAPQKPDAVVVALAGPVTGGCGRLTNGSLAVDAAELERLSGVPALLCNDFTAQAHACVTEVGQRASCVLGSPRPIDGSAPLGVIGPGTGLGMAVLVPETGSRQAWRALPSEGGHAAFPFVGEEECAFAQRAQAWLDAPFVSAEQVLCGQGLARLHKYLSGEDLTPAEVGATAMQHDSPTLAWYARFLGRACRNWVLATLCAGGLWIAGGIAAANPLSVAHPAFVAGYLAPGARSDIVANTPVYLMDDGTSGLWGAASLGRQAFF